MTHALEEIHSQPSIWRQVVDAAKQLSDGLPRPGERVAFTGCGTSWFMSMSAASLREAAGQGESDAFTSSEFPIDRHYDRVIAITRSGTTTEVIDLLEKLTDTPTTVITAVADSPVTPLADHTILLDFADEKSVLQTRYATAVLALIRLSLGHDLTTAISQAEEALRLDLPQELVGAEQISFLGQGWTVGLAHEAALKTRESSQFWAEAYPAMDYRHGPISIAESGRAVWMFGDAPEGLADDVRRTGAFWFSSSWDPMAQLVLAQRVAVAISQSRGLDTDNPRHLSRSIVLR
jgi:fructoselysine-6-P-deglycase FrlB-like protein